MGWDSTNNAISLTSGQSYTSVGGELTTSGNSDRLTVNVSNSVVYLDGTQISLTAYNINGNNYFKLRDIADAINFGVTWNQETNMISIDTTTGYNAG